MRVTRPLLLFLAVAMVAAGCAAQPVAYAPMAPPASIDTMMYGSPGAAYTPGYRPAAPPPSYAQAYATPSGRGLFQGSFSPSPGGYAPNYAPRYAATYAPPVVAAPAAPPGYPAANPPPVPARNFVPGGTYSYVPNGVAIATPAPTAQSAYALDSGDRLRVVVFGQDGLTNSYAVDAGGHIDMPLIGSVEARGLTTDALAARIADKLRNGYVRDPHVAVEIEAYRPFFILGEVTAPGQYPYVANMTAETAVAIAGGFGPRAYRQTVILNRTQNGQQLRMTVPLSYPLRPGDTINVQERWF